MEPSVCAEPIETVVDNHTLAALWQRGDDISVRKYHIILRTADDDISLCGRQEPSLVVIVVRYTVESDSHRTHRERLYIYLACRSYWSFYHNIFTHSLSKPYTVSVPIVDATQIDRHASERKSGQNQIHRTMNQFESEGRMLTIEMSVVNIESYTV